MFSHDRYYEQTKKWNVSSEIPTFSLVLSSSAAKDAKKHVDHYLNKGLLVKLEGLAALAEWMKLPISTVDATLQAYQRDAKNGHDEWGKTSFSGVPLEDLASEIYYSGTVTPVLHYCMGGLTIQQGWQLSNAKIAAKASNTKLLLDLMSRSRWDSNSSYCRSKQPTQRRNHYWKSEVSR